MFLEVFFEYSVLVIQLAVPCFQTPQEVEPVQIWPPLQLVKVYCKLGCNKKLGLTGRPTRPIGALGTSKVKKASFYNCQ